MDEFNQIYEDWIDDINSRPLTTSRFRQYNNVIRMNQQIINRIYSIRRHLEMNDFEEPVVDTSQTPFTLFDQDPRHFQIQNSITGNGDLFTTGIVSNLFSMLLQGVDTINTDNLEDVKVTLTEQQFDSLFSEKLTDKNIHNYTCECNICMDEYVVDDVIVKLDCKHVFHKACIRNWLCNERVTCPVCRKDTRETLV